MAENSRLELPHVIFGIVVLVALVGSGFVMFAQDELGADLFPQAKNVFGAVTVAVIYGLGGFLKNQSPESFDSVKFVITLIISCITGYVMWYVGLDYSSALKVVETWFANAGLLAMVEVWLKAVIRQNAGRT